MDYSNKIGERVLLRDGTSAKVIAFEPEAPEDQQLVILRNDPKGICTRYIDGRCKRDSATYSDIIGPPTKTIRMRAYRHPRGVIQAVPEGDGFLFEIGGGRWEPCSEVFEVEVEA